MTVGTKFYDEVRINKTVNDFMFVNCITNEEGVPKIELKRDRHDRFSIWMTFFRSAVRCHSPFRKKSLLQEGPVSYVERI